MGVRSERVIKEELRKQKRSDEEVSRVLGRREGVSRKGMHGEWMSKEELSLVEEVRD